MFNFVVSRWRKEREEARAYGINQPYSIINKQSFTFCVFLAAESSKYSGIHE